MKKKRHPMKRIPALLLAGILCFGSVPQSVYASDISEEKTPETIQPENVSEETGNELQQENNVRKEIEESGTELIGTENLEPQIVIPGAVRLKEAATPQEMAEQVETTVTEHTRLIVVSENNLTECYGATECIRGYGNLHILTYEDADTCENAYAQFTAAGMTVEYDEIIEAYDEETEEVKSQEETLEDANKETKSEDQEKETAEKKEEKQEIVVAVIDTGADSSSEILKGRIKEDGYIPDVNGHGTLMAEIIAANTKETVKILPIQAFDENGKGTVSTTYLAILEAVDKKADIINLSVSGAGTSPMLQSAIKKAKEAGIPVIVSAGNNAQDTEGFFPANIEDAITVSATDETKTFAKEYSNYGKQVDFSAVGTVSRDNGTEDTVDDVTYSGTSVSAAYVTSYAAWILSENENADVEACLKESAEDLGEMGKDTLYGYGYVSRENIISNIQKEENKENGGNKEDADDVVTKEDGEQELKTASSPFQIYQYGNGYVGIELHGFSNYPYNMHNDGLCMKIGVWCIENGQDDLCWYKMTKRSDGVWIYTIPLSNHRQEGVYAVHAYYGSTNIATGSFTVSGASGTGAFVGDTGSTDSLYAYGFHIKPGSNTISRVQFAVWTEENGQDDLCWYDGWQAWSNAEGTTYAVSFDIKEHKRLASGIYNVHVYVTDSAGITKCVAAWQGTATCTSSYNANQSKTGYHVEKIGTESCHHSPEGCAYVACIGEGLAPGDDYLWATRWTSNPTPSHPLNVSWWWAPNFSNFGIGNESVSHQVLNATVDGTEITLAAPYWCPDGYAGYSYFYHMFSYCDKCDKWLWVGSMHKWLGCAKGDVGINEVHPSSYGHTVDVWGLKPNQYTLRFHGNGATSGSMSDQSCSYDVDYNVSKNQFQRTGHIFKGWSGASNSSSIALTDQQRISGWDVPHGATIDLYAVWEPSTYYIDYDGNGADSGSMDRQSVPYDMSVNLKKNAYAKEGYTFRGWNTKPDGSGTSYADRQSIRNLSNKNGAVIKLYAQWKENEYTLVFDGNGADIGSMENVTIHYTDTLKLPKNLYENTTIPCTYLGWIHDQDALKADYEDEEELEVKKIIKKAGKEAEDGAVITLYAFWDIAPEIEAKDWYIGKETARNMTEEQLLERAKATDREDGELERGTELVVVDFDKEDFLHLGQIGSCSVTYQATDSAGNITYKDIKVEVSEDGWLDMPYYIRFISEEFYGQKPEDGGCVDGSVWNELPEYKKELTDAFARIKNDTGVITYVFGRNDIKASHDFTEEHGFGEFQEDGALNLWLDAFAHCKQ